LSLFFSNFVNSEIYSIYVFSQFKAQSLTEHIRRAKRLPLWKPNLLVSV